MTRRAAALWTLGTVILGLASRKVVHLGIYAWDKCLGDVLYTVMVGFLMLVWRPTLSWRVVGAGSFAFSFAIELFQLTGIPARMPSILWLVFGTSFAWHDVACYVVGAIAVAAITRLASR